MPKKRVFILGLALAMAQFFSVSCTRHGSKSGKEPVIIVNGDSLTAADFARQLARQLKNYDALAAKDQTNIKRAKESILRDYIVATLLEQYAKAHGITVTPQEIDDEFDRVRKTYPDDLSFKASMASDGVSIDEWRKGLAHRLLERKVFALLTPSATVDKAAEEEARKYFENHKAEFNSPAQIHLVQIVVPKEDDAERILQKLKAGASFSDMAKRFSVAPEGKKGGDLGYVDKGTLSIFDGAFSLKMGQVSPVIKSSYGFHIMKVLDKKPEGHASFDKVKAKLIRRVLADRQQAAFSHWLEEAVKDAKIQRNDALLDKIKVRTEGEGE
jgi:parvulin-like peptidyl-prolyl isomerase